MLTRVLILTPLILSLAVTLFAGQSKIDMTGIWGLDREKSENLEGEDYLLVAIKIVQKADSLSTERTYELWYGDRYPFIENLVLNGEDHKHYIYEMPRKISGKWSKDGKSVSLNISGVLYTDSGDIEYNSNETWSLHEKGSVLTIVSKRAVSSETSTRILVYTKQKD
jgi:hypothetical protein